MPLGLEYYDTTDKPTTKPLVGSVDTVNQHKDSIYRVYIANVTPIDCAHWLEYASIPGATITQGFGYWEGVLEPQCAVELCGIGQAAIQAFLDYIFEDTDEQAVYLVSLEVNYAQEVYRAPFDQQHEKSL